MDKICGVLPLYRDCQPDPAVGIRYRIHPCNGNSYVSLPCTSVDIPKGKGYISVGSWVTSDIERQFLCQRHGGVHRQPVATYHSDMDGLPDSTVGDIGKARYVIDVLQCITFGLVVEGDAYHRLL